MTSEALADSSSRATVLLVIAPLGLYAGSNGTLLKVGGTATLMCTKHQPTESVFWWRDDRQLQNDTSKYLIHTNDVNSTLTILNTGTATRVVIPVACLYYITCSLVTKLLIKLSLSTFIISLSWFSEILCIVYNTFHTFVVVNGALRLCLYTEANIRKVFVQGRSQKFVLGTYKFLGGGIKLQYSCSIAILTSFLPHKKLLGLIYRRRYAPDFVAVEMHKPMDTNAPWAWSARIQSGKRISASTTTPTSVAVVDAGTRKSFFISIR